jgi:YhcH/YjgK/YiaL family protein
MVLDNLQNASLYTHLNPRISKALDYLKTTDFSKLELGRYDLEGDDLFAILMEYDTKPESECKLEAHRKYIDVQYVVSGEELVGFTLAGTEKVTEPYNDTKDVVFFEAETATFLFKAGQFAVFYPQDLHKPGFTTAAPSKLKKVVMKVKI